MQEESDILDSKALALVRPAKAKALDSKITRSHAPAHSYIYKGNQLPLHHYLLRYFVCRGNPLWLPSEAFNY